MDYNFIYLDNNATTRPLDEVNALALTISKYHFLNTNTDTKYAQDLNKQIDKLSENILKIAKLDKSKYKVIYASCASEINKAIILYFDKNNVLTTPYEHKSILDNMKDIPKIKLDISDGTVDISDLKDKIKNNKPKLVSVMGANNEFPVRNNIAEIYKICKKENIIFHSDCTQIFGKEIDIKWDADIITFSMHKINGPKGVGVMIYNSEKIDPINLPLVRGTPNSVAILSCFPCFDLNINTNMSDSFFFDLRKKLFKYLNYENIIYKSLEPENPGLLNFNTCLLSFKGKCNILLKKNLDKHNIIVSIGSACRTNEKNASDTIRALNLIKYEGIIRISFGRYTTKEDLKIFSKTLKEILPECDYENNKI